MDCGIVSLGQFFGPNGILTYNDFRTTFPTASTDFLLFHGVVSAVKSYQRKLGLNAKENLLLVTHWFGNVWVRVV